MIGLVIEPKKQTQKKVKIQYQQCVFIERTKNVLRVRRFPSSKCIYYNSNNKMSEDQKTPKKW